jgi:hypothetical protein
MPGEVAPWVGASYPDLLANLYAAYASHVLLFPESQVAPEPGLTLIYSGRPSAELNIAFVEEAQDPGAVVERAAVFFRERRRPWRLEAAAALERALDAPARAAGLTEFSQRPALVCPRDDLRPGSPTPELRIEEVRSLDEANLFFRTLREGMSGVPPDRATPLGRTRLRGLHDYIGYWNSEPVATAIGFVHRGVVGIYGVATVIRARRRGFGRAMTARALRDGFSEDARTGFLQSTSMGRPVYEAMGFRWTFDRPVWASEDGGD